MGRQLQDASYINKGRYVPCVMLGVGKGNFNQAVCPRCLLHKMPTAHQWLVINGDSNAMSLKDDAQKMLAKAGKKPLNLISIFGAARQVGGTHTCRVECF